MVLAIHFPIIDAYNTEEHALVIVDSFDVTHFFNLDGSYGGSVPSEIVDSETGVNLN